MWKFYLSHEGQQLGPFAVGEIFLKIKEKQFDVTTYLYNEPTKEWNLLCEHPLFSFLFDSPVIVESSATDFDLGEVLSDEKVWFVLKNKTQYGPFSYFELIKVLQEKNLYSFDYVWKQGLPGWIRISECKAFKPELIKKVRESQHPDLDNVFYLRRYARARYDAEVLVHNKMATWKGQSEEISPGGAGLFIDSATFEPNQNVFLHFRIGDEVPPFNAIGSIVSKQIMDQIGERVKYGVRFTNISKDVQEAIKQYTEKKSA